jgi:uncharacterized protein YerC
MTQVSRRPLSKGIFNRIFEIFISSFSHANNKNKARKFLSEVFSESEQIMIAKRLAIAFLLSKKYSFDSISHLLKVSNGTICNVNRFIKKDKSGYSEILKEVAREKSDTGNSLSYLLEMINGFLPPAIGTNWKEENKKHYKRLRELDELDAPF